MSSSAAENHLNVTQTFLKFEKDFVYKDERLYSMIFHRNNDKIKVNKEKFAVRNLEKIFKATFSIAPKTGFEAMSLRDLSAETGLSMGGLYSSISSKEAIVVIIKDVVSVVCDDIVETSLAQKTPSESLQALVRGYLYASTIMHSWFNFLYFETKSLPHLEQEASKNIELAQVKAFTNVLKQINPDASINHNFAATMAMSLIQERYLKPWKYHQPRMTVDQYAEDCLALIYKSIDSQST